MRVKFECRWGSGYPVRHMSTLKTIAELDEFFALSRGILFIDVTWSEPCAQSRGTVVAFHKAWQAGPHAGEDVRFARVDVSGGAGEIHDRLRAWFNGAGFPGPELMGGGNGPVAWSCCGAMAGAVMSAHRAGVDDLVDRTCTAFSL
jgi:hypothetical protein